MIPFDLDEIDPKLLAKLTPAERKEVDALLEVLTPVWRPDPKNKPQQLAFEMAGKVQVMGYGGAAGGGKSDLGIGLALLCHRVSHIFRRQGTEVGGITDRIEQILGHDKGLGGKPPKWKRPLAGVDLMQFAGLPNLKDWKNFQGIAKDFLWFDEASNFLEAQVINLSGWLRDALNPDQHCMMLLTFNPPTSADGRWIVDYFAPWVDSDHPEPAEDGEIRWFVRVGDVEHEVEDDTPFVVVDDEWIADFDPDEFSRLDVYHPESRTFIASKVTDNSYLARDDQYIARLQSLPEPMRSQMLNGDFKAGMEDDAMQVIPTAWVEAAQARWKPLKKLPEMDSVGVDVAMRGRDKTVIARRHGWWFDELKVFDGNLCVDGPTVAGYILSAVRDRAPIHIDLFGVGAEPYGHLKEQRIQVIGCNVGDPPRGIAEESNLRFYNWRSELWWRMREALDPVRAEKTGIALPPTPGLKSDLCAPTWEFVSNKIKVEGREKIIKRLGRSPDMGSALILAMLDTAKRHVVERGHTGRGPKAASEYDPYKAVKRR